MSLDVLIWGDSAETFEGLRLKTKQEAVGAYIWASMHYACVKFLCELEMCE